MRISNDILLPVFEPASMFEPGEYRDEKINKRLSHMRRSEIRQLCDWLKRAIKNNCKFKYMAVVPGQSYRTGYLVDASHMKNILDLALSEQTGRCNGDRTLQPK